LKDEERVWNTYVVVYIYFLRNGNRYVLRLSLLRQCVCLSTEKKHDFRESYFFMVVCAVVCAFMICIIVSYGTTVFFAGVGCVVCMVDLYIFLYSCLY
jgi:hypothetical protein